MAIRGSGPTNAPDTHPAVSKKGARGEAPKKTSPTWPAADKSVAPFSTPLCARPIGRTLRIGLTNSEWRENWTNTNACSSCAAPTRTPSSPPAGPWRSRAIITQAPKFYLFDVGVAGHLAGRRVANAAGPEFGRALEHFVLMELLAYRSYREVDCPIRFWRTKSGLECDFVLGRDADAAIEVKGASNIGPRDLSGLTAFAQEHRPRHAIVVCNEPAPRRIATGIWVLPWRNFLERLWDGQVVA